MLGKSQKGAQKCHSGSLFFEEISVVKRDLRSGSAPLLRITQSTLQYVGLCFSKPLALSMVI